jgi:hypothetical protein
MYVNTQADGNGLYRSLVGDNDGRVIISPVVGGLSLEQELTINDSDKTFTVPAETLWLIKYVWVELATSATVGNRQIVLELQDGASDVIWRAYSPITQAASLTYNYAFFPGAPHATSLVASEYMPISIPSILLAATQKIRIYDKAAIAAATDDMVIHMTYDAIDVTT